MDTPDTGVQVEEDAAEATGDTGQAEGGKKTEFVIGTYRSREDAERGFREKDETINRLRSERDRATAALSDKLSEAVQRIAETHAGKSKPAEDIEARVNTLVNDLAEAWRSDETKGARKTLEVMNAYITDVDRTGTERIEKIRKEVRDEFTQQLEGLKALMADRDPDYVPVREKVSELAKELGLDERQHREVLLKIAKRDMKTQHPERHELPGGVVGGGRAAAGGGEDELSPQEWAILEDGLGVKFTEKQRAAMRRRS